MDLRKENAGRRIRKHVVEYMLCHSMEGSTKGGKGGGVSQRTQALLDNRECRSN